MIEHTEDYIGDGVYTEYDGFGVWLKTNNHLHPDDKVYIEPQVWRALKRFMQRVGIEPPEDLEV